MTLTSGVKLGPYEILSPIGAGGMGEVYRARDTRLDRTVAIKVLNSSLASSPELRQRFEREGRAVSKLNHPHICTLYDIGRQDATDYLVMEFLDGESLAERLRKGALPSSEVLKIGIEIADALDKAHRIGIVHRDIKPGNIMLTKAGAKLLDFGLAKPLNAIASAATGNGSPPSFTASPTLTSPSPLASPITTQGTVIGTIQYMSPEQIEGKEADARSDIFSFGATLYEMVTGKRAFQGKSQLKVASAILEDEPQPVNVVVPNIAPTLNHVITTCLKKDPDERFQSAADLKLELKWAAQLPVVVPTNEADSPGRRSHLPVLVGVAALILIGLLIASGLWISSLRRDVAHKSLPTRASILPGGDLTYRVQTNLALSPDGRRLAFNAYGPKGDLNLWVRDLASLTDQEFPNTENAYLPFWSPDGRYIGFFADGKVRKVDSLGGPPQVVADAPNPRGGTWGADGVIVFAPQTGGSLFRVPAAGGEASAVAKLDSSAGNFNSYRYPFFLPDGRHFLFLARGNPDTVKVGSVDGGEPKTLLPGSNAAYAAGYLLFVRQNTLMAQRFNPDRLELQGDPVPLASGGRLRPAEP
jgi:serine/threonine protein kinase